MIPARFRLPIALSVLSGHFPIFRNVLPSHLCSAFSLSFTEKIGLHEETLRTLSKRAAKRHTTEFYVFACLIPVLVMLSGIFAGLTLGYMSLDETQLHVLSMSGTSKQREYANKIKPIRENGHLLLVTLLLANMIVNETLPVISSPVLGGGAEAIVVSTVLIVLFSEIIPQSVCTRYGLYIGAKMATPVRILIYVFFIVAWPVAKLLEFVLGPHHGIIYRRAELKELIAMHESTNPLGGDLRTDTVTIIGAALDLQDKTVRNAMTPINQVFMLHIDSKLDYDTLRRICATGHSRIPVYESVEINVAPGVAIEAWQMGLYDDSQQYDDLEAKKGLEASSELVKIKVKKIIGILLVKQCILLDPEDAVPVRKMRLNKVPFVPQNEPLLGMLDHFQEGRSHIAVVSRLSKERAQSVKQAVRKGLTRRLLGVFHSDTESEESSDEDDKTTAVGSDFTQTATLDSVCEKEAPKVRFTRSSEKSARRRRLNKRKNSSGRKSETDLEQGDQATGKSQDKEIARKTALEQTTPADAVLSKEGANEYLSAQAVDLSLMPLGIITLEDVLEELIGEEIYDEFDNEGTGAHSTSFVPPGAESHLRLLKGKMADDHAGKGGENNMVPATAESKAASIMNLKGFGLFRNKSNVSTSRNTGHSSSSSDVITTRSRNSNTNDTSGNLSQARARGEAEAPTVPEFEITVHASDDLQPISKSDSRGSASTESNAASTVGKQTEGTLNSAVGPIVAPITMPAAVQAKSTHVPNANALLLSSSRISTTSRVPPTQSLEAILLDRKRRGANSTVFGGGTLSSGSAATASGAANAHRSTTVSGMGSASGSATARGPIATLTVEVRRPRGGGFKSSPLTQNFDVEQQAYHDSGENPEKQPPDNNVEDDNTNDG